MLAVLICGSSDAGDLRSGQCWASPAESGFYLVDVSLAIRTQLYNDAAEAVLMVFPLVILLQGPCG